MMNFTKSHSSKPETMGLPPAAACRAISLTKVMSNEMDKQLEREFMNKQLCQFLVMTNFTKSDSSGPETMGLPPVVACRAVNLTKVMSNEMDKQLERQFTNKQLCQFLVMMKFMKSNSSGPEMMGLLHTTSGGLQCVLSKEMKG